MTRYHPVLVALHWLMALMILMALVFGKTALESIPNSDPTKVEGLAGHMTIGIAVGALLILRLATRLMSAQPPHASTGTPILDKLGMATHWAFYILIALMVMSGMGTASTNGLFDIVFGGSGDPLPESFASAPRTVHGIVSNLLILLVLLHIAAAIYHQVVLKDGLLSRMWFGKRNSDPAE